MPRPTHESRVILPIFWRKSQYKDFEEAKAQGGVYKGVHCAGYTCFCDAMDNAAAAAECFGMKDELMVHLIVDGQDYGDHPIDDCC